MPVQPTSNYKLRARTLLVVGFCLFILLFTFNSLTRTRLFTIDSYNYIDVARNIKTGNGLTQSIQIIDEPLTLSGKVDTLTPFTIQAPLYPLLITLVSRMGIPEADSALVVSSIAMGIILLASFLLGRDLYDEPTGWLAIGLLILGPNLEYVTRLAWSEAVAIAFLLLSLWLLVKVIRTSIGWRPVALACLAGLGAGLAFAARYAMAPLLIFCLGILWFERRKIKSKWVEMGSLLAGWLLAAGPVLAHNLLTIGRLLPETLPSERSIITSLSDVINALFGNYISLSLNTRIHYVFLPVYLILIWLITYQQGRAKRYFVHVLIRYGRYILIMWPIVYIVFLLGLRSLSHFDELDLRLVSPAVPTLVILVTALGTGLFRPAHPESEYHSDLLDENTRRLVFPQRWLFILTGLILILACGREISLAMSPPARSFEEEIAASPRLSWIATQTGQNDLIIGDGAAFIPVLFDRSAVISFSGYPYTIQLSQDALVRLVRENCGIFEDFYLVLGRHPGSEQKHRQEYGEFIGKLMYGKMKDYEGLELLLESEEGFIYRLDYCPSE